MVGIFTGNRAGVLLLLPFIVVLYHLINHFSGGHYRPQVANMGFWGADYFLTPLISEICAAVIVVLNAIGINMIYNSNEFYERNTYISSLLYVVFMSFYHSFYSVDGLLIAHTALILLISQIFRLRQNEDGRTAVFNAAIFGGLAATFHPPMIAVFPFVLVMIWNIRPFIVREFFLALSGFAIPLVYAYTYFWYTGQKLKWDILQQVSDFYKEQTDFYVTSGLFVFLIVLSSISIRNKTQKSSIRLKKLVNILWLLMAIGFLYGMIDLLFFDQMERFSFLMVPMAFFLSFSFMDKKLSAPASVLFYLTFGYSLINFFF
ncbi:MAG: DUF6427 family protein [Cryomorphaceae bacterium]|jgi:hypothetical protein|nr:DUF6427 family protein [Cryomorphaceae bacterium]